MQRQPIISQKDSDENESIRQSQQQLKTKQLKKPQQNNNNKIYKSSQSLMIKFNAIVRSGYFKEFQSLSIYYTVYSGNNWSKKSGQNTGISQISYSPQGNIIWNFPIQIVFETDYLINPPQIIFVLYGHDFFGRSIPKAYGNIHFPLNQGTLRRKVRMFKMSQYSFFTKIYSLFTGSYYQFKEIENVLNSSEHRASLKTQTCGEIEIEFQTKRFNFEKYGYQN